MLVGSSGMGKSRFKQCLDIGDQFEIYLVKLNLCLDSLIRSRNQMP